VLEVPRQRPHRARLEIDLEHVPHEPVQKHQPPPIRRPVRPQAGGQKLRDVRREVVGRGAGEGALPFV
jgi:hypothetical protein